MVQEKILVDTIDVGDAILKYLEDYNPAGYSTRLTNIEKLEHDRWEITFRRYSSCE